MNKLFEAVVDHEGKVVKVVLLVLVVIAVYFNFFA